MHESFFCLLDISSSNKETTLGKTSRLGQTTRQFAPLSSNFRLGLSHIKQIALIHISWETALSLFWHCRRVERPIQTWLTCSQNRARQGCKCAVVVKGEVETDYQLNSKGDFTIPSSFVGYGYFSFYTWVSIGKFTVEKGNSRQISRLGD